MKARVFGWAVAAMLGSLAVVAALSMMNTVKATPEPLPWLGVGTGGRIVRIDSGEEVALRGVNVLRNEWVYPSMEFERAAIPNLAGVWHANLITHGFAADPVNAGDAQYLGVLDEYVDLAESNGMYIVLCYYYDAIDGDQPPYPFPSAQEALVRLTERYRDRSNVLFMLQAEPHSDWWPQYPDGTSYHVTWNSPDPNGYDVNIQLRPIYDQMITAMREVDNPSPRKHLILASGDGYGRDISPVVIDEYGHGGPDPIQNSENVVYSSHPYDTQAGSNNWDYWRPVAEAGYPVIVTEFGTGGQMAQSDTVALMNLMSALHVSWTAWIFDQEGCPCLLSNRTGFVASNPYGTAVRSRIIAEASLGQGPQPTPTPIPTVTPVPEPTPTPTLCYNGETYAALIAAFGSMVGDPGYNPVVDFNSDGVVNNQDFVILVNNYGGCR